MKNFLNNMFKKKKEPSNVIIEEKAETTQPTKDTTIHKGGTYQRICCSKCRRPGGIKGERSYLVKVKPETYICGRCLPINFIKRRANT